MSDVEELEASFSNLLEDLLDVDIPISVKLSPDGKKVVYGTRLKWQHKKGDSKRNSIWIADVDKEKSARMMTNGLYNDRLPQWSPDGKCVAFLSDRGKPGKATAIYLLCLDGYEPAAFTPAEHERPIAKFEFSPDRKRIAFLRASEKTTEQREKEESKDDVQVWGEDWEYNHLWLGDIETGKIERLIDAKLHVTDFAWSQDGAEMAVATDRTPHIESGYLHGTTVSILDVVSRKTREICNVPLGLTSLTWTGSALHFLTNNVPGNDLSGYAVYSVNLKQDEPYDYIKTAHGQEDCPMGLQRVGNDTLVYVQHGMEDHLEFLHGDVLVSQRMRIDDFDAVMCNIGETQKPVVAMTTGHVNSPSEVFSVQPGGGQRVQLSDHGRKLVADAKFGGSCVFLECQSLDNKEKLESFYVVPTQHLGKAGKPTSPLPTFVLLHGGPYGRITDSFESWNPHHFLIPALLREGCGVLVPNYRGSSGRGERFASYSHGGMGVYDEPDVVATTTHAVTQGFADKSRLVVGGWSQGGYLSYLSAVRNGTHGLGWRFNGVIAGAGVTDWDAMSITSDIGYLEAQMGGGAPWELPRNNTRTRSGSALWEFNEAAREGRIPDVLMTHGEEDPRVPITQAWAFRRALEQAGLPFEFATYPRELHWFTERKHLEDLMKRTMRFLRKHLS